MAKFEIADKLTRVAEGKYSNNINDRGGETYKGIARKMHPKWEGWALIDKLKRATGFPAILDSNAELQSYVTAFFRSEFWDAMNLDLVVSQPIANELYDTAINCGTGTAGLFLQRVLNVSNQNGKYYKDLKPDGNIGSITVRALNSHPRPMSILNGLNCLQGERYITICENNPSQEEFYNGWMTRVNEYCGN